MEEVCYNFQDLHRVNEHTHTHAHTNIRYISFPDLRTEDICFRLMDLAATLLRNSMITEHIPVCYEHYVLSIYLLAIFIEVK